MGSAFSESNRLENWERVSEPSGEVPVRVDKSAIMTYPLIAYRGDVVVVDTLEQMRVAVMAVMDAKVVGLDTESRPAFRRGEYYPPSLIQVATAKAVYLFKIDLVGHFDPLVPFLENPRILKVGVAIKDDIRHLQNLQPFKGAGIVELSDYARKVGIEQTGLRNLVAILMQARLSKGAQTSNWANPRLSDAQKLYAATDAWVSRELFFKFLQLGVIQW